MQARTGIAVAGTILVDKLYEISAYPNAGELTKIRNVCFSAGGLVPNDAVDLKKICPTLPVYAFGKVGNDDEGRFVLNLMQSQGVDISGICISESERTGFTDVMSVVGGQRTFFTYAGANATFGMEEIPWESLSCKMLHLGYFLLLDRIDSGDGLQILREAKERGISTSIDLVSENSDRYAGVLPCLPYVDHLIINEVEAGNLCGMDVTDQNLIDIADRLLEMGVKEHVIIHTPTLGLCKTHRACTVLPSYDLPSGFIKGTTGAGDAFCAGALAALYYGLSEQAVLEYAQMAAVASLQSTDATSGLAELNELIRLTKNLSRKTEH